MEASCEENVSPININSLESLREYLSNRNTSENSFYLSSVPEICKDSPCILGIDEAGRGPVLGPMVYAIAFCPVEKEQQLKVLECDDSKALTEVKRDAIFSNICKFEDTIGWAVEVISPNTISNNMLSRTKHSLNAISMDSAVGLTKTVIKAGVNVSHLYVDTVGKPEKYQAYLSEIFPSIKITVAKKADSTYPIVSAASICAKVTRDHALNVWKFPEKLDISVKDLGSGYPGDPVTKKFLVDQLDPVFGYPQIVRFGWSTAFNVLEKNAYHVEWEECEDEEKNPPSTSTITSFFAPSKPRISKRKDHEFFKLRKLTTTTSL